MIVLKQLFNFYINSSIHVALAVYSLTYLTLLEFEIPYNEPVLYFVFYATITGYNFVKFYGLAKFHYRSLAVWLKVIQLFSLICFVLMCYYGVQLPRHILVFIVSFGIITFFYAIPFPRRVFVDNQQNLRGIGGLKVYVIAFVWSGVTVFLPVLSQDISISADVCITGLQRFVFIILLMLPFEIRDLKFDSLKLSTIPQKIGVKYTKGVGVLIAILILMLEFFKDNLQINQVFTLIVVLLITLLLLLFSKEKQNKYYCAFWVEGLPLLWLLLFLMFS